jgi:hypothetical protein
MHRLALQHELAEILGHRAADLGDAVMARLELVPPTT